jgi:hypothetical protein
MMTLGSTPACVSRTTCASGLAGKILGGGLTGVAGSTGATELDVALAAGGGAGCGCALALCGGHINAAASAAIPVAARINLEVEFFINLALFKELFTINEGFDCFDRQSIQMA